MPICYTRNDVLEHVRDYYYEYKMTYSEESPTYSHGGLPEEGIFVCKDCGAEVDDGHNNACSIEDEYNKFVSIILRLEWDAGQESIH